MQFLLKKGFVSLVQGPRKSSLYPLSGLLRDIRTFGRAVEVPVFRPSRTQWAVSLAEDAEVTHQEHSQILHSSAPGHVSDPRDLFHPPALVALPSAREKRTPTTVPAPHGKIEHL